MTICYQSALVSQRIHVWKPDKRPYGVGRYTVQDFFRFQLDRIRGINIACHQRSSRLHLYLKNVIVHRCILQTLLKNNSVWFWSIGQIGVGHQLLIERQ